MNAMPVETLMPTKRIADQDQKIANAITSAQQVLDSALAIPDIVEILSQTGYDQATMQEGLDLRTAAQEAFTARQNAMATQASATALLLGKETTARETYADFREVARAIYSDPSDRTAMALSGNVPKDRQKFITTTRASYQTALQEPYVSVLAVYGFSPETITAASDTLDELALADDDQNAAIAAAVQATADRDQAAKALDEWMSQFKHIANVALKDKPDLKKALEVMR